MTIEQLHRIFHEAAFQKAIGVPEMIPRTPEQRHQHDSRQRALRDFKSTIEEARIHGIEKGIAIGEWIASMIAIPNRINAMISCRYPLLFSLLVLFSSADSTAWTLAQDDSQDPPDVLQTGFAEIDLTPPTGFPMAGYYHERLAEGTIDPLKARAIVFRSGQTAAALVVCDLIGIATDLSREVRRIAAEQTGIPADNIVIAATHSHTAPDYMKELFLYLGSQEQLPERRDYIRQLIDGPVRAIVTAANAADAGSGGRPRILRAGSVRQQTPVSFNRRFVMRDGSVRTWMNLANPDVVRPAGPIDPEIGLLVIDDPESQQPQAVVSNFALHLDTVGGSRWSADYPFFIQQSLRESLGSDLLSLFATGCCGDINHVDPARSERNRADFIGTAIGNSIRSQLDQLQPLTSGRLNVAARNVLLPLQEVSRQEVERSVSLLQIAGKGGQVDFFDHVTAYKMLILDQLHHAQPYAVTADHITWGLSRSLAGVGDHLPVDVTVMALGSEVAIVCLPGEVFVELGLAIKQASPFRTTLVIELANCVETVYIPHRAAYASGSYEVTNTLLQPGSGELLVETAVALLRAVAAEQR